MAGEHLKKSATYRREIGPPKGLCEEHRRDRLFGISEMMRGNHKSEKPYILTRTARHKAMGVNRIPTEIMHYSKEAEPFLQAARI